MENKARFFYGELLGMSEIPKPPKLVARGGVWFQSDTVFVHVGADLDFRPALKAHPAFVCSDYAALVQRLRSQGVEILDDERLADGRRLVTLPTPSATASNSSSNAVTYVKWSRLERYEALAGLPNAMAISTTSSSLSESRRIATS